MVSLALAALVLLVGCAPGAVADSRPVGRAAQLTTVPTTTAKPQGFDTSVGAVLPNYRLVTYYGIVGGVEFNGAASTLNMLDQKLPELQQLGKEYAELDPIHPVKLGIDLVVNVLQPCSAFPRYCASWPDDDTMQAYVDYCQKHDLQLFFDLQLGTEPVKDAVDNHLIKYLEGYPFTHLALDTEFHFPDNPAGYAQAKGYPCCTGQMPADEINWASDRLAGIARDKHLPRKVLLVHEFMAYVLPDKDKIKRNPDISLVLQADGWGYVPDKISKYNLFVQQELLQYGGYKIFLKYSGTDTSDRPIQTPKDILELFPQPLFISYE